jgi:dTDP-4-dehydrorhamnose reductase
MRLLVTGAAGMLGHRVVAVARERGHEVVAADLPEADLTDAAQARELVERAAPDAVVNCAAYTDVDGAEAGEAAATRINGDAAGHLAQAAPYLVHVSTDYVFAGDAERPYVESDPVGPQTAYGRSKLAGEEAVRSAGDGHAIVRTAWLYGPGGKNFVDTILRLGDERDQIDVVVDQLGSPTWTGHLAPALVEVAERRLAGVVHAAGGGDCTWHALAVEALNRAGVSTRVVAVRTEAFPRPAPRPAFSVLGSERDDAPRLPTWQEGVAAHVAEGGAA